MGNRSMKFDVTEKSINISIREFASSMNLENSSNYVSYRLRTKIGQDSHKIYQENVKEGVETEYYINFTYKVGDWDLKLRGRADVVHIKKKSVRVEEIKSVTSNLENYDEDSINPAYEMQLQLYSHYFKKYENFSQVDAVMVLIDTKGNTKEIEIETRNLDDFLQEYGQALVDYVSELENQKNLRSKRADLLKFPFSKYRPKQKEIISKVDEAIRNRGRILLSAPSGLGKTLATLYPALKYTLQNDLRLFVVTSKTTQQEIYKLTLDKMLAKNSDFNAIILTAKSKMCHVDENNCVNNDCKYLENYMNSDNQEVIADLLQHKIIDERLVKEEADKYDYCPFELSLDASLGCDIIIGDYNYSFHPRIQLQRYFHQDYRDSIIIVDEAHNLPTRANEYYSLGISIFEIYKVVEFLESSDMPKRFKTNGKTLLMKFYRYIQTFKDQIPDFNHVEHAQVKFDEKLIVELQKEFDNYTIKYIDYLMEMSSGELSKDALIYFSDKFKFFTNLLKVSDQAEFSQIYDVSSANMRILCKSSGKMLAEQFKGFHSVIVQSATINPFEYFSHMLGLPKKTTILDYPSPFPKKNQLFLIFPEISTKYKERNYHVNTIVKVILETVSLKKGNYLLFFPSFAFLNTVKLVLEKESLKQKLLVQEGKMSDYRRKSFLKKLKSKKDNYLLLAVLGGIFSEGVDYPGVMASGAFICGPGLPSYNFDQELKKQYFQSEFDKGFEYAYKNPGLTKVIQAAGRIFRTPKDRGFVLLMGYRFATDYYKISLPTYWDLKTSKDPVGEIGEFWDSFE